MSDRTRLLGRGRAPRNRSRSVALLGAGALLVSGTVSGLGTGTASASSHREAPLISGDPRADNTDVYAFTSPDKPSMVTIIANWIPFEEPNGGPNFYTFATDARYNIKIDNNGDGAPDVTYSWTFQNHVRDDANQFLYNTGVVRNLTDPTLNVYQTYTLTETTSDGRSHTLLSNKIVTPSDVGPASMPSYAALRRQNIAQGKLPDGGQNYVGQADDPFFLDLRVFDLLYGGNLSERGHDTLAGYNVNTIALQVPKTELALNGTVSRNPVIGIWSTTDRQSTSVSSGGTVSAYGDFHQVSRLGNPLVNEAVVPLKYKDAFNAITPAQDHTVAPVVDAVLHPIVPELLEQVYGLSDPEQSRTDLFEIFLTGIAKNAPAPSGQPPIQADLNSQILNKDVNADNFVPSEELRLNMSVPVTAHPNRLGVLGGDLQGFPNGRRLTDDVVDIELQALEGAAQSGHLVQALAAGDKVNANDVPFSGTFPYIALPHDTAVNTAG